MTTQPPEDSGLAVAVGRLEEGQKHVMDALKEIKGMITGALEQIAEERRQRTELEREHAVTRRDVDDIQRWRQEAEPKLNEAHSAAEQAKAQTARKPPWTAIGALIVAIASGTIALLKDLIA